MKAEKKPREKPAQLFLFEPPTQVNRRRSAEDDELFRAVVRLRKSGKSVYAAGYSHLVDGDLLSTDQLLAAAAVLTP
jgi:hypothetical protein